MDTINPYQSPETQSQIQPLQLPLAGRGGRLAARMIDGVLTLVSMFPGIGIMMLDPSFFEQGSEPGVLGLAGVAVAMLGIFAFAIVNWVLTARQGQTIGKWLMGVRIVSTRGEAAHPINSVLLRSIAFNFVLGGLNAVSCGLSDLLTRPANALFIFRDDRRCLHDLLAETCVVVAEHNPYAQ